MVNKMASWSLPALEGRLVIHDCGSCDEGIWINTCQTEPLEAIKGNKS